MWYDPTSPVKTLHLLHLSIHLFALTPRSCTFYNPPVACWSPISALSLAVHFCSPIAVHFCYPFLVSPLSLAGLPIALPFQVSPLSLAGLPAPLLSHFKSRHSRLLVFLPIASLACCFSRYISALPFLVSPLSLAGLPARLLLSPLMLAGLIAHRLSRLLLI